MATANFFTQYHDLDGNTPRQWTANFVGPDRIVYATAFQQMNVLGNFTIGADGKVSGGTVTGVELNAVVASEGGYIEMPVLSIRDLSADAYVFFEPMASPAGPPSGYIHAWDVFGFLLSGDDTIVGSSSHDWLLGFAGNDRILAGDGYDHILAGPGNDVIDGGPARDWVTYGGTLPGYKLERAGNGFTVTDLHGDGGTDTLVGVERIAFDDKVVAVVGLDSTDAQVIRLYRAAFDRNPDEYGLDAWTGVLDGRGLGLDVVAGGFIQSKEYQDLYGTGLSSHDLVAKYYEHILHRAADEPALPSGPRCSTATRRRRPRCWPLSARAPRA
jgi:Ca2+-binding RTX toxin-like protein